MIVNDLNKKVVGRFYKEIIIDDNDGDNVTYIFPDTKEFISVIKRKLIARRLIADEKV
ncbi:MAG: hypothetical protein ACFFAN_02425 [Promethearchaeota archaeon]